MSTATGSRPPVLIFGAHLAALGVLRILARHGIQAYVVDDTTNVIVHSRWYRPAERTLAAERLWAHCPANGGIRSRGRRQV